MPPSTQNFIKRLARLAPQLGSSGMPNAQLAQQVGELFPGGGPSTTTPWGGGSATVMPPTTTTPPSVGVGPPSPRTAPVMPQISPASIAAKAPNAAPAPAPTGPAAAMSLDGLTGTATATGGPNGIQKAMANFDPLTHWLTEESKSKQAGQAGTTSKRYNSIGEIYAEAPPADNASIGAFNQDRLGKIARFYGLDDSQIADRIKMAEGQVAALAKEAGLSGKDMQSEDGRAIINQVYQAIGTDIIKSQDRSVHRANNDPAALSGYTGSETAKDQFGSNPMNGGQIVSSAVNSPFAEYGIYTPEQQIAMQSMIGQFVQGQDAQFAASSGGHLDPNISAAYAAQAQVMPAIQAFEGQAQLAKQNQQLQAQYDNLKMQYQIQQWMQGQANQQSSGATSTADFTEMVNGLMGGGQ